MTDEELRKLFAKFGPLQYSKVVLDRTNQQGQPPCCDAPVALTCAVVGLVKLRSDAVATHCMATLASRGFQVRSFPFDFYLAVLSEL